MRFCWAQYALWIVIAVLGTGAILSGCGAKGPLYLPEAEQQKIRARAATPATVEATTEATTPAADTDAQTPAGGAHSPE